MSNESKLNKVVKEFKRDTDYFLFGLALVVVFGFIATYLSNPDRAWEIIDFASDWMYTQLAWMYLIGMLVFVITIVLLIFGPWGRIKLGGADAEPEHSYLQYWAMFFSAGIAAGVVFWGPAEAIYHFEFVPPMFDAAPQSEGAMEPALRYTMFHWGFSAWASYAVFGIPIAYFVYNRGAPMRVSAILAPFIGVENVEENRWGKLIDIIAVFGTLGAISTTLGFVGQQLLGGINYQWGIEFTDVGTIAVIAGLTTLISLSVVLGIKRGIRRLSMVNVYGFVILTVAAFILGPTSFVLNLGSEAVGNYLSEFVALSLYANASGNVEWVGAWTIFYWAWWLAFAPIMGIFFARISKGRTVREMAFTGVVATTSAVIPWYIVLGGTAINFQFHGRADILGAISDHGVEVAGFALFDSMPFGDVLSYLFLFLVATFFITTADSASYGISMIIESGKEQPSPINRITWGAMLGLIAGMLLVLGGLEALEAVAIMTGGPLAIIGVISVIGISWEFSHQYQRLLIKKGGFLTPNDNSKSDPRETNKSVEVSEDD